MTDPLALVLSVMVRVLIASCVVSLAVLAIGLWLASRRP